MMDFLTTFVADAFWSGIAAVGFAILFNAPPRVLLGCALTGAIGHSIRTLTVEAGGDIVFGTLLGATAIGFVGYWIGQYYRTPLPVFTICGAIPLVPGFFAYSTMLGILDLSQAHANQEILLSTVNNAIKTGLILAAIAVGITAPILLFKQQKPVV